MTACASILLVLLALLAYLYPVDFHAACKGATKCSQMETCEQAYACLLDGNAGLDRDHDGVPCESICGGGK